MQKTEAYKNLVKKRMKCRQCNGLCNPSDIDNGILDSNHLGPWSIWQHNLDAKILIVGQDWGDINYFNKWKGKDQAAGNPTNENLQMFLKILDIDIGKPYYPVKQPVFLTNIILCLKKDGLQGDVKKEWFNNCSKLFFKELVEIIKPRVIISLGKKTCESLFELYNIPYNKNLIFSETIRKSPFLLNEKTFLFPVYHCGARSINCNRSLPSQWEDWTNISLWLKDDEQTHSDYVKIQLKYLLFWLLKYSAELKFKWKYLEKTILRLAEVMIPSCSQEYGNIRTPDFYIEISKVDFSDEAITINRIDKMLVAIQPTKDFKIKISVFHALDAKAIEILMNICLHPHPEHGVCMRDNNWEYALDMASSGMPSMLAKDRGESYFSYWGHGIGIMSDGKMDKASKRYHKANPLKPNIVAAQIGSYYELQETL